MDEFVSIFDEVRVLFPRVFSFILPFLLISLNISLFRIIIRSINRYSSLPFSKSDPEQDDDSDQDKNQDEDVETYLKKSLVDYYSLYSASSVEISDLGFIDWLIARDLFDHAEYFTKELDYFHSVFNDH